MACICTIVLGLPAIAAGCAALWLLALAYRRCSGLRPRGW